jgi:hypothetical protein
MHPAQTSQCPFSVQSADCHPQSSTDVPTGVDFPFRNRPSNFPNFLIFLPSCSRFSLVRHQYFSLMETQRNSWVGICDELLTG